MLTPTRNNKNITNIHNLEFVIMVSVMVGYYPFRAWSPKMSLGRRSWLIRLSLLNVSPLSANATKSSNTLTLCRQQPTNCFSVFDHFVGFALKRLEAKSGDYLLYRTTSIIFGTNIQLHKVNGKRKERERWNRCITK